jgi:hypothetical protein
MTSAPTATGAVTGQKPANRTRAPRNRFPAADSPVLLHPNQETTA